MNHGRKIRKFGRTTKPRKALMRSLAHALIATGRIKTTEAKAKSLKTYVEKMISQGKKNNLATWRGLIAELGPKPAHKLTKEIAPRFQERAGGYLRIIKLPPRISDGSPMAIVEFVS